MSDAVGTNENDREADRAAEALRKREQDLAVALRVTQLGTWDWDLSSNEVLWSSEHAELFGYAPTLTKATYDMWRCRVHAEDVVRTEESIQRAIRTGERYQCEYRVVLPDRSTRWIEAHGETLGGEGQRPSRMIGAVRDITRRKLLELELRQARDELDSRVASRTEQLQQSERQYRLLAEHGTDMISRISPEGIYRYASPACRTLLGYEPQEMVGRVGMDLIHPDDHPLGQQAHDFVMSHTEVYTITCRCIRKDGTLVWVEATCRAIRDDETGQVTEIIAASRDVSERIRANDELQRHLNILNAVLEGTTDAIFVKDAQGRYLMINWAGGKAVGKAADEVLGHDDTALFAPESASQIMDFDRLVMEQGTTLTREQVSTAAGVTRIYLVIKGPYRDPHGRVIGVVGIARDITERKQAELALQASEAKTRAVLAAVPDMMFRIRTDGTIVEFKGAPGMTPYKPPEEFLGRRLQDVLPPRIAESLTKTATAAVKQNALQELEYELPGADGLEHFEARFVALGQEEILAIVRDVTERKRAEAHARHLLAELSHAARLTTVGVMASGLAHELNQPLFAISNYVSTATNLLRSGTAEPAPVLDYLAKAIEQAHVAASIVRHVRSFVVHREPRLSTVNLNSVVQEAVRLHQSWQDEHAAAVLLDLADGLPPLHLDRILIQQLLINLIRNADEAMASLGDTARQIKITTSQRDAKTVLVSVCDNGPGLPPDIAAHLFEPFRSTKPHGLGLGLTISRSIVEAHHGRLTAEPNPVRGTTFRFTLPIGLPSG